MSNRNWVVTRDGHIEFQGEEPIYETYGKHAYCHEDPSSPECENVARALGKDMVEMLIDSGYMQVIIKEAPEDAPDGVKSTVAVKLRVVHPERLKNPDWRPDAK